MSESGSERGESISYGSSDNKEDKVEKVAETVESIINPKKESSSDDELHSDKKSDKHSKSHSNSDYSDEIVIQTPHRAENNSSNELKDKTPPTSPKSPFKLKTFKYKNGNRKYLFRDDDDDVKEKPNPGEKQDKKSRPWFDDSEKAEGIDSLTSKTSKTSKKKKSKSKFLNFESDSDSEHEVVIGKSLKRANKAEQLKLDNKYLNTEADSDSDDLKSTKTRDADLNQENQQPTKVTKKATSKFLVLSSDDENTNENERKPVEELVLPKHKAQPKPKRPKQKSDPRLQLMIEVNTKVDENNAKRMTGEEEKLRMEQETTKSESISLSTRKSTNQAKKIVKSRNIDSNISHGSPMDKKFLKIKNSDSSSSDIEEESLNTPIRSFKTDPAASRLNKYNIEKSEASVHE
ncbi:hypothetical protein TVAG_439790 [Trichomonas vaginalis G3]|uniref:Uncharacterized protein n=1 Tax=Trichomonas vaginalis (strain ATCC PRA-98 / G3) TaxID=412133 RepID=A2G7K1_TRIV3|nr:hypothetical protein TVAGG3_0872440 [Trichomonas vaginalis G3]EAX86863.1 hypothetical protein TVAG_439790 [Trichomonas vaginalis G3]KAI5501463.1 hypothetical protein TVAGG3_0872440 [Trichomonas vaginalis G3]|eukprot:XP_001299793.1 hypothetical protein [Trichomonas vaginalis G3]